VNRRQLSLVLILNAFISLAIALSVAWIVEARRPDPEELAALAGVASIGDAGSRPGAGVDLPPTATVPTGAPSAATSAPADQPAAPAEEPQPAGEPAAEPAAPATGEEEVYVVQAGDTLGGIATKLGVTVQQLLDANGLNDANFIFSGQRLAVPGTGGAGLPTPTTQTTPLGTTGLTIRTVANPGALSEEYVEIVNDTDLSFNLQGWKLQRAGGPEFTFSDLLVFPGGSVRLYSGSGTDTTIQRYWNQSAPVWSAGATAILVNAQGERVAEYVVP
jgi:LysM repeat protein